MISTIKISTKLALYAISALFLISVFISLVPGKAKAVSASDWKPGRIIDDAVFFNKDAMNPQQIQAFLNSKVPVCDTWHNWSGTVNGVWNAPPYTCLKDFSENGKSAAQIIWEAGQNYGINPQVLIATLQKETALVTDPWAAPWQYQRAMGYACPDTAECDSRYYWFTNQVHSAAWQFRRYVDYPNSFNFKAGVTRNIQWHPNAGCGSSPVYIETQGTAALYNYTPYQPNGAALNNMYGTGDGCSAYGNRNFWRTFNDWFGETPKAYQSSNGGPIYFNMQGYRIIVNQMAVLQDYGISPESIKTVSDAYINSTNDPATKSISTSLGSLVKSPSDTDGDGGSVYLISVGKKYQIQSMDQFNNFGFKHSDIKYYPLDFINSLNSGGSLNNFVSSPQYNAFKIENSQKRLLFSYNDFQYFNPSLVATPLSYYMIDQVAPAGSPLVQGPALVKEPTGDTVRLLSNETYYGITSYDTFRCWGLEDTLRMPVYRIPRNDYVANPNVSSNLNCTINKDGQPYLLNKHYKITAPAISDLASTPEDTRLNYLIERLPTRSEPLKQYVKKDTEQAIWYIEGDQKKLIPTYMSYVYLGLNQSSYDTIYGDLLNNIPSNGIKLANGQLVKTNNDSSVFGIINNERVPYLTSDLFLSYGNKWEDIASFDRAALDKNYPLASGASIDSFFFNQDNNSLYLIGANKCMLMTDAIIQAYGIDKAAIISKQSINKSLFPGINLLSCPDATIYVKIQGDSLVYMMAGGKKHPITTYSSLINLGGGKEPIITTVDKKIMDEIKLGDNI